jgi:hypothetical protein
VHTYNTNNIERKEEEGCQNNKQTNKQTRRHTYNSHMATKTWEKRNEEEEAGKTMKQEEEEEKEEEKAKKTAYRYIRAKDQENGSAVVCGG